MTQFILIQHNNPVTQNEPEVVEFLEGELEKVIEYTKELTAKALTREHSFHVYNPSEIEVRKLNSTRYFGQFGNIYYILIEKRIIE